MPAACDETSRELVEIALFWGPDLLHVAYVPRSATPSFADWHVPEAVPLALPRGPVGSVAETRAGAFGARATVVHAGRRAARDRPALRPPLLVLAAAALHALVFASLARFPSESRDVAIDRVRAYVDGADMRSAGTSALGTAAPARSPDLVASDPPQSAPIAPADDAPTTLEEARTFGVIGLLGAAGGGSEPFAPAPDSGFWMGSVFGDANGAAGLGLSGTGAGGGGVGAGVPLSRVGTVGGSSACYGRVGLARHVAGPVCHLHFVEPTVPGRLPSEAVQRVVRASFGRFRACYEAGLARDPKLSGRVSTKFVIDRDGSVGAVADGGSDLADDAVRTCIRAAFRSLEFPQPPNGVVTVVYPLQLSPE